MHEIKSGNVEMAFEEDGVVIVEGEMRVGSCSAWGCSEGLVSDAVVSAGAF